MNEYWSRPCAAEGFISYRARGRYGFIMIGARDNADALREAKRSNPAITADMLEIWNNAQYERIPT